MIAYNRGAASEVINNGQTGYVVNDFESLLKAIANIQNISRTTCRQWVQQNFNAEIMAQNYENFYYEILQK